MDRTGEVDRARAGDREACARLFSRHWTVVRGWMCGALGDPHEAEDLTQQTFVRAFTRLRQLRDPACFEPWLRSIARSVLRNRMRRPPAQILRSERRVADPADLAGDAEMREHVRGALARLARNDRVILSLAVVEELPLARVSRFLDIPVTTLRRRLARAVARLGRSLEREGIRHAV